MINKMIEQVKYSWEKAHDIHRTAIASIQLRCKSLCADIYSRGNIPHIFFT